jgi:UDP-2-acetamido-3-amino-2,3-dideoxy-glucuronate N-acetyltransferase
MSIYHERPHFYWSDKLLLYAHEIQWQNNIPVPAKAEPERLDIPQDEPLRLECEHFLDCVENNKKPLTDGNEGMRVLKVLNASQLSLDENGRKITTSLSAESADKEVRVTLRESAANEYFVHKTAVIDEGVSIGNGTKIWHFSHVLSGSKIGEQCNIGQNVVIGPDVSIGNTCKIQNNVSVYKGVTLEDGVFCGPSMVFTNVYNPRAEIRKMDQVRPTLIKKGSTIGANATVICGVTLGFYSFIGAGAVITRNVADYALVVGNPAKRIGWMCECGERLPDDLECLSCGKRFDKKGEGVGPADR